MEERNTRYEAYRLWQREIKSRFSKGKTIREGEENYLLWGKLVLLCRLSLFLFLLQNKKSVFGGQNKTFKNKKKKNKL